MTLTIGRNISSLLAQRHLEKSSTSLNRIFEQLSSGLRITKAADDAAGLAVATHLNVQSRLFSQGIRNLNDGISAVSIADSAANELNAMVDRMYELATQSATGTLTNRQRLVLNQELTALRNEFNRVVDTTKFNGVSLLHHGTESLMLSSGQGTTQFGAAINFTNLGVRAAGTGSIQSVLDTQTSTYIVNDFNVDGIQDLIYQSSFGSAIGVGFGNGDGTFRVGTSYSIDAGVRASLDFNGDGNPDLLTTGGAASYSIAYGNGDGSFRAKVLLSSASDLIADLNRDGIDDIFSLSGSTGTIQYGGSGGTTRTQTLPNLLSSAAYNSGDINNDGYLDLVATSTTNTVVYLANSDGSFRVGITSAGDYHGSPKLGDVNGDGFDDLVDINGAQDSVRVLLGNGNGSFRYQTFATVNNSDTIALGDIDGDSLEDLVVGDAADLHVFLSNGNGTFRYADLFSNGFMHSIINLVDMNGDGALDQIVMNNDTNATEIHLSATRRISKLEELSVESRSDAKTTLRRLDAIKEQLLLARSKMGSLETRLSVGIANLSNARVNYDAARSRIADVDIAEASSGLIKQKILQQTGMAILSQANFIPALALQLLK